MSSSATPRTRASRWSSSPATTSSGRSRRGRTGWYLWLGGTTQTEGPDRAFMRGTVPAMASADQIRLLLVEDVPQVAQYVRGLLNAQSQVRLVDIVADGTLVSDRIGEHRPDVVVVDALLQGRPRGMQLVKQLHDQKIGVPVIVLTVPQNPISVDPDKGIDEVLSMPFNGYDLMTRITGVHKAAAAATDRGPSRTVVRFAPS